VLAPYEKQAFRGEETRRGYPESGARLEVGAELSGGGKVAAAGSCGGEANGSAARDIFLVQDVARRDGVRRRLIRRLDRRERAFHVDFRVRVVEHEDGLAIDLGEGRDLFLGEIRTCTCSGGSYEQEKHLYELLDKQGQIKGNLERSQANFPYINSRLSGLGIPLLEGPHRIHGVVITDKPFGVGFDCFPYPIVDLTTLLQLLSNKDISDKHIKPLRESGEALAEDFASLLKKPPVALASIRDVSMTNFGIIDGSHPPMRTRMWGYNH
jgi:hypothetical protein